MAEFKLSQSSFNAGELAPTLLSRDDIEQYRQGADKLRNVVVVPHGDAKRRPGLRFHEEIVKKTYHHWGQVGNVIPGPAGVGKVLDLTGTEMGYSPAHTSADQLFIVFQPALYVQDDKNAIKQLLHTRDFTYDVPTKTVTFLISLTPGDEIFFISEHDAAAYEERIGTGLDDEVKLFEFEFSTTQKYLMVFASWSCSIYRNESATDVDDYVRQFILPCPFVGRAVPLLQATQNLDTMLIFHKNVETVMVQRAGSHTAWTRVAYPYTNIPQVEFDDAFSPNGASGPVSVGVDHVQHILFMDFGTDGAGDTFTYSLYVNGESTGPIAYKHGSATNVTNLQTALVAMNGVEGVAGVDVVATVFDTTGTSTEILEVTFTLLAGKKHYDIQPGSGDFTGFNTGATIRGELICTERVKGVGEVEDVWSLVRGYPRCGNFFENRLWVAGSYSLPQDTWSSRAGNFFDFNNTEIDADYGISRSLNTDKVSAIFNLHIGRHFNALTSSGEFYAAISDKEGLTPENFFLRRNTQQGSKEGIRSIDLKGSIIFVQRFGKTVMELGYDERQQAYDTVNLAKLSPQVLSGPIALAYRTAIETNEADYVYAVNGDGTLAIFNTLKEDGVNAWSLCSTTGSFIGTAVVDTDSLFAVRRLIDGTNRVYLESFDEDLYVDGGVSGTTAISSSLGGAHLTGETVDLIIDGNLETPVLAHVSPGELLPLTTTFGSTSVASWQFGLPFPDVSADGSGKQTLIKLLPLQADPRQSLRGEVSGIVDVVVRVFETSQLKIQIDDSADSYAFPFRYLNSSLLDSAVPAYTGIVKIEGIKGWSESSQLSLFQTESLPMMVLGITLKADG